MQKYIKMYYKSKQNSLIKNITIEKKTKHKLKVIKNEYSKVDSKNKNRLKTKHKIKKQ